MTLSFSKFDANSSSIIISPNAHFQGPIIGVNGRKGRGTLEAILGNWEQVVRDLVRVLTSK